MARKILLGLLLGAVFFSTYGQIFEQHFNFGRAITPYFKKNNPNSNQFTFISNYGEQRSGIETGFLKFNKTGRSSAVAVRSVAFESSPNFLYVSFKYQISGNVSSDPIATQAYFWVGEGFYDDATIPIDSENVHSKFSFHYTGDGKFKLSDAKGAFSPEFNGAQTITFVINNSGSEKQYTTPNGEKAKVGNDKWSLWVGSINVFENKDAVSASVALNSFKFQVLSSAINGVTKLDDFVISDYQSLSNPQEEIKVKNGKYPNYKKTLTASKRWLQLPIKNRGTKRDMKIDINGSEVRYFNVELADGSPDWYAYVDLNEISGQTFDVMVDSLPENSIAFSHIILLDDKPIDQSLYKETYRGQFHYSAAKGWNNDVNGLTYYNGEYHLFYQHNPYGRQWGNMHWGHATSTDLVHWKELDMALYPDSSGFMYSGGGVVDVNNTSGFTQSGQHPLVVYFTATGPPRVQRMAYSPDGKTFTKIERPVLNQISSFNRDPKVVWYEPTQQWVMVLYVEGVDNQHTMQFFTSPNMIDWKHTSTFYGGKGTTDKYLYECPEFYELPVDESTNHEKKWVLIGANGQYAIGTFDGLVFTAEAERITSILGSGYYAGQLFTNEPKGRAVEMWWYRTNTDQVNMNFSQSISIPIELKLKQTTQGLRIFRSPVEELKSLRLSTYTYQNEILGTSYQTKDINADLQEVKIVVNPNNAEQLIFNIRGITFTYTTATSEFVYKDQSVNVPLQDGKLSLQMFIDRTGIELFINDGLFLVPANVNLTPSNTAIKVRTTSGTALINIMEIHKLKSIWNEEDYQQDTATISFTTNKSVGTELTLKLRSKISGIKIDWGNGTKTTYDASEFPEGESNSITGTTTGTNIKIYNDDLYFIECVSGGVTNIDFSKASELESVYLNKNNLTSIDVSTNIKLKALNIAQNNITSLDLIKNTMINNLFIQNNQFDACALDNIYNYLPAKTVSASTILRNASNPGTETSNTTIVTAKNWEIDVLGNGTGCFYTKVNNGELSNFFFDNRVFRIEKVVDKIEILNISGNVFSEVYNSSSIDVSKLPKGAYVVKIHQEDKYIDTFKIIIK